MSEMIASVDVPVDVVVRVAEGSRYATMGRDVAIALNQYHGVRAVLAATQDTQQGGRGWLRESMDLVANASAYICFVDERWFAAEEPMLELSLALRRALHTENQPIALPIVCSELDALCTRWNDPTSADGLQDVGPTLEAAMPVLPTLKAMTFHLLTDQPATQLALRVINLLRSLDFPIDVHAPCPATGAPIIDAYAAKLGGEGRKPNSGLVRAFHEQVQGAPSAPGCGQCTALRLPRLYIADVGTVALSSILGMLPRLVELDLSGNGVNNGGVAALCKAAVYHPSLTTINLQNNLFSVPGAAELLLLLRANRRIIGLDIRDNFVQSEVWQRRIDDELQRNQALAENPLGTTALGRGGGGAEEVRGSDGRRPAHLLPSYFLNSSRGGKPAPLPQLSTWHVTLTRLFSSNQPATKPPVVHPVRISINVSRWDPASSATALGFDPSAVLGASATAALQNHQQQQEDVYQGTWQVGGPGHPSGASVATAVSKYLDDHLPLNQLTFTRLNSKTLKFVLEGSGGDGVESTLLNAVLPWLQTTTDAPRRIPSELLHGAEQRFVVRIQDDRSGADEPEASHFVECDLGLFGLNQRLSKSLVQHYRAADITKYSGNIVDEFVALATLYADGEAASGLVSPLSSAGSPLAAGAFTNASSPVAGGSAVRDAAAAADGEMQASLRAQSRVHAQRAIDAWGGGGGGR